MLLTDPVSKSYNADLCIAQKQGRPDMSDQNKKTVTTKKDWRKPQVRAVVPASHTRAGFIPAGPQEDAFYRIS
jgi:hypothetical protein